MNRLSPYNIKDDLVRGELYRDIRNGQDNEDWTEYEVSLDEVLMPEKIAHRYYGIDSLKWVVLVAAGIDDMRDRMEAGSTLRLPSLVWIRQKIRYYKGIEDGNE